MTKKHIPLTREQFKEEYQKPPFNYSGVQLDQAMARYDHMVEYLKTHPLHVPPDMRRASLTGHSDTTIDDYMWFHCECGAEFPIAGGNITLCPTCGRGYRVVSYIAQYEKRSNGN